MSFETVYVRLLDEGTDVWRLAPARMVEGQVYELLQPENYDPEDENWQFVPGTFIVCDRRNGLLYATRLA